MVAPLSINSVFPTFDFKKWLNKFAIFLDHHTTVEHEGDNWFYETLQDEYYLSIHEDYFYSQNHRINDISEEDWIAGYMHYLCLFTRFMKVISEEDVRLIDVHHEIFSRVYTNREHYAETVTNPDIKRNLKTLLQDLQVTISE